jgi:diadenosine tetraphosphate (Ap4A) HIT family hydrolase
MSTIIYETKELKLEVEPNQIPWLKLFTITPYKEVSEVPSVLRGEIYEHLHLIETEMIDYFNPKKINIASFGNYLPHLHWHIMARFEEDAYFPEPMWGVKQRESTLTLPPFKPFYENLNTKLSTLKITS